MEPKLLRRIPVLEGLQEKELLELSKLMFRKTYHKGEIIFNEGDIGNSMYIIKSGKVKVIKIAEDGQEKILTIFTNDDFLGEMAILDSETRSATAEVMEDTELYVLYKEDFIKLLKENFNIVMRIFTTLSNRVRALNHKVEILTFENVQVRFADVLFDLMEKYGKEEKEGINIDIQLTHKDLANMLGVTRETMTRLITKMKKENFINITDKKIVVIDKDRIIDMIGKDVTKK